MVDVVIVQIPTEQSCNTSRKSECNQSHGGYTQVSEVAEPCEGALPQLPDVVVVEQQRVEIFESAHAIGRNVTDLVEPEVPESTYNTLFKESTGKLYKAVPRLRECCRQVEAQEVSNSRNIIHQTWERP